MKHCWAARGSNIGGNVTVTAVYIEIVGSQPGHGLLLRHSVIQYANLVELVEVLARATYDAPAFSPVVGWV